MHFNHRILAVDDNADNLQILEECLGDAFEMRCVTSGQEALCIAPEFMPDVVLLDLMMPGLDGWETCRLLRIQPELSNAKIVMLSARAELAERLAAYQLGAVDYIAKPFDPREIQAKVATWTHMIHKQQVEAIWEDLEHTRNGIGLALTSVAEFRDTESEDHLFRMRWYSQLLAEQLSVASPYADQIDEAFLRKLYRASPLHDIGKVAIDDAILRKASPLTASEFESIKRHTDIGSDILSRAAGDLPSADYLGMATSIARHHHERWDGAGYPYGLFGQEIPLAARIVAVADLFDALTSDRANRVAVTPEEALRIIEDGSGSHFDPLLVQAFSGRFDDIRQAWQRFWDNEHPHAKAMDLIGGLAHRGAERTAVDHLEYSALDD
ncbi:MAG TPA: HD domain-containing phosphohydrolase [Pirellulales bacterium]|jgi:putative two-component system response regulator|nr:HD domain-containing phosphohydrolase [Pirellulales bacterium]